MFVMLIHSSKFQQTKLCCAILYICWRTDDIIYGAGRMNNAKDTLESRMAVSNTFHMDISAGRYRSDATSCRGFAVGYILVPSYLGIKGKYKKQHLRLSSVSFALFIRPAPYIMSGCWNNLVLS